ncbi:MAG: hypothetical protein PHQ86_02070 [Dehalococcoidales bacterium]|nr:hypothetical protein [Dehalococcoidales bacterium]
MEDQIIKRFMTSIKCSVCGQHYDIDDVQILDHKENLWFFSVSCSNCKTQCLVAAVIKEDRKPSGITDLTEVELDKFRNLDNITTNEVLDMHSFLESFNGDFTQLFSEDI